MTGYQEVMTDPSYAGQIINFTFPHIGNVGTNPEDAEALNSHALGAIVRQDVTDPSNFRSTQHFDAWMRSNGRIGISGVDTRALTRLIRVAGAPNAVIAHSASGNFDVPAMLARAKAWAGLEGMDLAKDVTTLQTYGWDQGLWNLGIGYAAPAKGRKKVVAIDYGIKHNILRNLVDVGCDVTIVPATATFEEIMGHAPDGLFLSNGPGDPAAVTYAIETVKGLVGKKPLFGICRGLQEINVALGGNLTREVRDHHAPDDVGFLEMFDHRHDVALTPGGLLARAHGRMALHVNSVHYEGIARLGDGLAVEAVAPDGMVEAVSARIGAAPVLAVQWHPEWTADTDGDAATFFHILGRALRGQHPETTP
jgi:carbamoyl-phosphate synthase small subunit